MTSDFVIRVAETGDVPQMQAIAHDAYNVYVEKMGRDPAPMHADFHTHISKDTVFVAMSGGDIAGYVILCNINDEWWLDNIATSPSHRGQGIGRLLVIAAEGWLAHRTDHVHLYTNIAMEANLVWYQRLGYERTGRRIVDGFDRVYFTTHLGEVAAGQP